MKYQRFTPSGCIDKSICKFEFVAKTKLINHIIWLGNHFSGSSIHKHHL